MSEQWTIENYTGAELIVRAPNGFAVELDANSADPRERFAYFAIRQQARDLDQLRTDLAAAVAERDDYRDELSGLCHTLSVGSEGRPEMTASDWRKRVDQGIEFLIRPLQERAERAEDELALAREQIARSDEHHQAAAMAMTENLRAEVTRLAGKLAQLQKESK